MRVLLLAAAGSTLAHAALVIWLARRADVGPRPAAPAARAVVDPGPPPEPFAVVLLAEPAAPATATVTSDRAGASPPRPGAVRADPPPSEHHDAPPRDAAAGPPTGRHPLFDMRRGVSSAWPSLALPAGRWDALDHPPAGTSPVTAPASGLFVEGGGGTLRSDQGAFVATVRRDGTVKLDDAPNLRVHVAVPSPGDLGRALAAWYDSDKGPQGTGGDTAMARQLQVTGGAPVERPDPTAPRRADRANTLIVPILSGGFDLTDWVMRDHGADPYASKKLALLDATRDERAALGARDRAAQLARAPAIVQRHLTALWAATGDLAARKQGLFELWDDCAETGDPAVTAAAEAARRMVIGFIRAQLPAGSAGAYTAAELAALARTQRSRAAFRPYD